MYNQKVWYWDTFYLHYHSLPFDVDYANTGDYLEHRRLYDLDSKRTKQEDQIFYEIYHKRVELRWITNTNFLPLPQEHMPDKMYSDKAVEKGMVLPELFFASVLVSQKKFVDILTQFRLGQTQIGQSMRFFDITTNECVNETEYYFINIAERHRYFLPDQQKIPKYKHYCADIHFPPYSQEDFCADNYPISSKALDCPVDIWHDPAIKNSLFLSDNLAQALLQSGIDKNLLEFLECPLVEPQD